MKNILGCAIILMISATGAFVYYAMDQGLEAGDGKDNIILNATIMLNFGNGTTQYYNVTNHTSSATVFSILHDIAKQNNFSIKTTYYGQFDSYFIDSIAETGGSTSFWIYYVNGEMGAVGADKKMVKEGDHIEWRLEDFS